jgi:hypothetical protein
MLTYLFKQKTKPKKNNQEATNKQEEKRKEQFIEA